MVGLLNLSAVPARRFFLDFMLHPVAFVALVAC